MTAPARDGAPLRLVPPTDGGADPPIAGRPTVIVGKDVHRVISELDAELGPLDPLLYQRDHELVAIVGSEDFEGRAAFARGTPIVRSHNEDSLTPRLTQFVRCVAFRAPSSSAKKSAKAGALDEPKAEPSEVIPPPAFVRKFLRALDWRHVRPLVGISECPVLRPDGSVWQTAGYDPETGYLYIPSMAYPIVPDAPTQGDATLAYAHLAEVFHDFPYVQPSHRAATVAAVLTLAARSAIRGAVPCWYFDASSSRSGKTLQLDAISTIVTGRSAGRMTYPVNDEEAEKVLSSYAMSGARLVPFDNVAGKFGSPKLDNVITAEDTVDLRVLGYTGIRTFQWRAIVFASGNGFEPRGDIAKRVLVPRLESPLAHPEKRNPSEFRHSPLLPWVLANRGSLLVDALTILRAYSVAGRPEQSGDSWSGFEAWSSLVASALVWAGAPDPRGARRGGDDDLDATVAAQRALVRAWPTLCLRNGSAALTLSQALRLAYPAPKRGEEPDGLDDFREAVAELTNAPSGAVPDSKRLGVAMRRIRRKTIDGARIDIDGQTGGMARWRVEVL